MTSLSPIAVLDSGAGGLSVVNALRKLLPYEELHYFADTAHLPYGTKSPELIKYLAHKMAQKLTELSSCKILVVACHTISTWCLLEIEDRLGLPVIGMVGPSIAGLRRLVQENPQLRSVALISTKATVSSLAYQKAWPFINHGKVELREHASGTLVNLVEDPDVDFTTMTAVAKQVLPDAIKESDALLIGCTHFSALVPVFPNVLKPGCLVVDSAMYAAEATRAKLASLSLLNENRREKRIIAYVSDNPERFQIIAQRFIDEALMIEWLRNYARS